MSNNEQYFYIHYPNYKKKKSSLNTHFVLFCLLHSPVGVSLIGLQQHQPIYLDSIFHCTSFPFGKSPDRTICHVHQRLLPCLWEKKINGKAENEVSMTLVSMTLLHPIALYNEISSCTFSLQFSALLLPRKSLQMFSNASPALLSVAFILY